MFFSGKITNSILTYLNRREADLGGLFDLTDIPTEFLRDPTCWLEAHKVEQFLATIESAYCSQFQGVALIEEVGHNCLDLRAWGVLDSVLRMMVKPQDIFVQPQRFISYFVSPAPPLARIERSEEGIAFDLPISDEEFPHVTTYLRAALEALPTFMGVEMAQAEWKQNRLSLCWARRQNSFFQVVEEGHNINPEFMRSLVKSLEEAQAQVEDKQKEVFDLKRQLKSLKLHQKENRLGEDAAANALWREAWRKRLEPVLNDLQGQFMRLVDYHTRAQQLVTLLGGSGKPTKPIQEAMRRVDWDFVKSEFHRGVEEGVQAIRQIRQACDSLEEPTNGRLLEPVAPKEERLAQIVERALLRVTPFLPPEARVDRLVFADQKLNVDPQALEDALSGLLTISAKALPHQGTIRLISRPRGSRIEIEISDTAPSTSAEAVADSDAFLEARSLVQKQRGKLSVATQSSEGSTFVIDLPSH